MSRRTLFSFAADADASVSPTEGLDKELKSVEDQNSVEKAMDKHMFEERMKKLRNLLDELAKDDWKYKPADHYIGFK